jgi:hypothetical protein
VNGTARVRPVIKSVTPESVKAGDSVNITTDDPVELQASITRYVSATHSVNIDQRSIIVTWTHSQDASKYTFKIPEKAGISRPGYYILIVLKA